VNDNNEKLGFLNLKMKMHLTTQKDRKCSTGKAFNSEVNMGTPIFINGMIFNNIEVVRQEVNAYNTQRKGENKENKE
jgi:hypothetical protein